MNSTYKTAIIMGVAIVGTVSAISLWLGTLEEESVPDIQADTDNAVPLDKMHLKTAPDLVGIADYINTTPEELEARMEGNVILYDIWTYSCINCIRTLPYITAWDEKYSDEGLLIIGVHSPEFEFEKDVDNVRTAVSKHGIEYPVVLDNDMDTWKAFENRYWPRKYIADHEGYIRYDKIGEGAYRETERVIQDLLKERADALGMQTASAQELVDIPEFEHTAFRTPELYLGYKLAQGRSQIGNEEGFRFGETVSYSLPERLNRDNFYLEGSWQNNPDGMKLVSDEGLVRLPYHAKEVNIVASGDARLEILLDGRPVPADMAGLDIEPDSTIISGEARLYNIIAADSASSHVLDIIVSDPGFEIFTYTFG